MKTLQDRLIAVLRTQTQDRGRFRWLAEHSGLSESNWKSCYYARQRPNPEMLEWVCREWPQFTLWLMTGSAYPVTGQIRPVLDEYRGVMQQDLWSAKRMKAAIALSAYCRERGLDEERLDIASAPKQLVESVANATRMASGELKAFVERPELAWEQAGELEHPEELLDGVGDLPRLEKASKSTKQNGA